MAEDLENKMVYEIQLKQLLLSMHLAILHCWHQLLAKYERTVFTNIPKAI